MKRPGSSIPQFVQRIPSDVRPRAIGLTLAIPRGGGGALVKITPAMTAIRCSLRSRDPGEAKIRQATASAYLETVWQALRGSSPVYLTNRDAHALAGDLYRAWAAGARESDLAAEFDPVTRTWTVAKVREVTGEEAAEGFAAAAHRLAETEDLEAALGPLVDRLLLAKGIAEVNPECRPVLLNAFAMALRDAFAVRERNATGDFTPDPKAQRFPSPMALAVPLRDAYAPHKGVALSPAPSAKLTLSGLVEAWWQEAKAADAAKPGTYRSYRNQMRGLIAFLKADDIARATPEALLSFKDHRLASGTVSAKTVKHGTLSALKTVFGWAVANRLLPINPAAGITIRLGKQPRKLRSKGFTEAEAVAILTAASKVQRGANMMPETAAAYRWVPWLCAYTGARVGELAQLRKQDLRREGGCWVMTITPEAGTVKTNEAREIVLHPHLVEQGFPEFVESAPSGHLFLRPAKTGDVLGPLQGVKNRLQEFARAIVTDRNVAPNHGWRHRFKTVGMEVGIPPRILDAIQGQAPTSVADHYGDVTLRTMADAIAKFPRIEV